MKERGLSKDEAFMVETAAAAEIVSEHKNKKEKHKAAFGTILVYLRILRSIGFVQAAFGMFSAFRFQPNLV